MLYDRNLLITQPMFINSLPLLIPNFHSSPLFIFKSRAPCHLRHGNFCSALSNSPSEFTISESQDAVWSAWMGPQACGEPWWEVRGKRGKRSGNFGLGSRWEVTSGWSWPLTKAGCFSAGMHPSAQLWVSTPFKLQRWVTALAAPGPRVRRRGSRPPHLYLQSSFCK